MGPPLNWSVEIIAALARFLPRDDRETEAAWLRTRVPHLAKFAYLNRIYKPAAAETRSREINGMILPSGIQDFYSNFNGLRLFVDDLVVFGFWAPNQLLDREDFFAVPTLSIIAVNQENARELRSLGQICVGSYGLDQSLVCVTAESGHVTCYEGANFGVVRKRWTDFKSWLPPEIERIGKLYDDTGHFLGAPEDTLPAVMN